jgi:hypothetical protein
MCLLFVIISRKPIDSAGTIKYDDDDDDNDNDDNDNDNDNDDPLQ